MHENQMQKANKDCKSDVHKCKSMLEITDMLLYSSHNLSL